MKIMGLMVQHSTKSQLIEKLLLKGLLIQTKIKQKKLAIEMMKILILKQANPISSLKQEEVQGPKGLNLQN
jgi:hypothetical protein